MTKLLIKRFIKDYENTQNSDVRTAYGKFSSIVGIVCNAILFISKLIVGTLSASVSITADAVNNLSDASSSIISLLGFKLAPGWPVPAPEVPQPAYRWLPPDIYTPGRSAPGPPGSPTSGSSKRHRSLCP